MNEIQNIPSHDIHQSVQWRQNNCCCGNFKSLIHLTHIQSYMNRRHCQVIWITDNFWFQPLWIFWKPAIIYWYTTIPILYGRLENKQGTVPHHTSYTWNLFSNPHAELGNTFLRKQMTTEVYIRLCNSFLQNTIYPGVNMGEEDTQPFQASSTQVSSLSV
jgi:hypothetical protein